MVAVFAHLTQVVTNGESSLRELHSVALSLRPCEKFKIFGHHLFVIHVAFEQLDTELELVCTGCSHYALLLRLPQPFKLPELLLVHDFKEVLV